MHRAVWKGKEVAVKVLLSHSSPSLRVWEGCRESRRCSRDTYPESYITKYTSIRREQTSSHYYTQRTNQLTSVAWQVHRAVWKGKEVAVKVQRTGLDALFKNDLQNLKFAAKVRPTLCRTCTSRLWLTWRPGDKSEGEHLREA